MRVAIINSARRWIGEAAHSLALAMGLRERGHEVLLGVRRGGEMDERARAEAERSGLRVLRLGLGSRFDPVADGRDLLRLRRRLAEGGFEILHCHRGKDHWLGEGARLLLPASRRPVLVRSRHVVTPVSGHVFNRWLYGRPALGVVAVSAAARESLGAVSGRLDSRRLRVILAAVDAERFCPERRDEAVRRGLGVGAGEVVVGLVGRFQRVKGQRQFLEAAARIARESAAPVRFLMAGRGSPVRRRVLVDHAVAHGLDAERLLAHGVFEDLPPVLAGLDIGVVASLGSEGSSRIVLEYMASGVAVVASRVGGIPDLIEPGRTGVLVEPGDVDALAEAVLGLLGDEGRRRRLGEAARRSVEARFTPGRWLEATEGFYRELLERREAS